MTVYQLKFSIYSSPFPPFSPSAIHRTQVLNCLQQPHSSIDSHLLPLLWLHFQDLLEEWVDPGYLVLEGGGAGRGQGTSKLYHCTCTHTCGGDGWVGYSTMTSHKRRQKVLDSAPQGPTGAASSTTAIGMTSEVNNILFYHIYHSLIFIES